MPKNTFFSLIICVLILINCLYGQNDSVNKKDDKYTYEYYIEGKKVSEDEFVKNNKTGIKKTFENKILLNEVELKNGKENGKFIAYLPNGRFSYIREYQNGRLQGAMVDWNENGQIVMLGYNDYIDSQQISQMFFRDEEGHLIKESVRLDNRGGETAWYKDGQLSSRYEISNNGADWKGKSWHENGKLAGQEEVKDGQDIRSIKYYENGQKRHEWYLMEGIGKYLDIKYYDNGQIKSHGQRQKETKQKEGAWIIWERDGNIKCIQTWKEGRRVDPPFLNYFPRELFYDEAIKDYDTFWLESHSEYLSALEEPVLYNFKTDKEVYRFTLLRAFHEPVSIRIEKEGGRFDLYAKMADLEGESAGVIEPGILIMSARKEIEKEYWERFLSLLEKTDYWRMETQEKDEFPGKEEGAIMVKTDGSHWLLEGLKKGQYHFVDRWSPDEKSEFRKCCEYLLALSDLKIKEIY